jgi:meso-butanediol dehydrogenase / (S,S)-butanediol dehydrogenase / diacetyl reductase
MRLDGVRAVITGGLSGIGEACVARFRSEGAAVTVIDRDSDPPVDVGDEAAVSSALAAAAAWMGGLDVLVNCAGIAVRQAADEQDAAGWDEVQRVNVRGTFLSSKHAVGYMKARGGSIIHMASVVGLVGVRNRAAYSTSKGAILALTRSMAMDYAQYGIRVNCLCPGFTRTPLTAGIFADAVRREKLTALHPLGRLGEPEDVANAAVFLASSEASWITGVALAVDGGFTAGHGVDV